MLEKKYNFNKKIKYRDTGSVLMAYNEDNSDMYEFNDIGGEIFKQIVDEKPLKIIFEELLEKYDGDKDEMFVDFKEIINRFIELNIINIVE